MTRLIPMVSTQIAPFSGSRPAPSQRSMTSATPSTASLLSSATSTRSPVCSRSSSLGAICRRSSRTFRKAQARFQISQVRSVRRRPITASPMRSSEPPPSMPITTTSDSASSRSRVRSGVARLSHQSAPSQRSVLRPIPISTLKCCEAKSASAAAPSRPAFSSSR